MLDPNVLVDIPVPIFKTFTQLLKENYWGFFYYLGFSLDPFLFTS